MVWAFLGLLLVVLVVVGIGALIIAGQDDDRFDRDLDNELDRHRREEWR